MTAVVDADGRLAGLFTDGDLRRILDLQVDIHHPIQPRHDGQLCYRGPEMMAAEAVKMMETRKDQRIVGSWMGRARWVPSTCMTC